MSQNSRIKGFSYYFCLPMEGSRFRSGSVPLSNGSVSGGAQNHDPEHCKVGNITCCLHGVSVTVIIRMYKKTLINRNGEVLTETFVNAN